MRLRDILSYAAKPRLANSLIRALEPAYSQYGEDRVFFSVFRPSARGTYIDVGSHDPVVGSNTFALYHRGWRGLTIDPNPRFSARYRTYRPDEPHAVRGISRLHSKMTYFEFDQSVLNTFSSETVEQLAAQGIPTVASHELDVSPLSDLVGQYLSGRHIDLLSVDCEGFDLEVLDSLDFRKTRPTTIIVEDHAAYDSLKNNTKTSDIALYLRDLNYTPVAQILLSTLYIANDWQDLFGKSNAYNADTAQTYLFPQSGLTSSELTACS